MTYGQEEPEEVRVSIKEIFSLISSSVVSSIHSDTQTSDYVKSFVSLSLALDGPTSV